MALPIKWCSLILSLSAVAAFAQTPGLLIGNYSLVSQVRVGRTVYDYTYRAMISNSGPSAASGVTATLTSLAAGTTVIDGSLSFGAVAAGAAVPSQDAFTIRVDRSFPFSDSNLVWTIHCTTCLKGILLEGSPGLPVRSAVRNLDLNDGIPEDQISLDANGLRIARTEVEIGFTDETTVAQINALLISINGRIVNMLEGVAILIVQIPDPGSLAALETIIQQVDSNPQVRFVRRGFFPEGKALPDNYHAASADLPKIAHHLAVRGHAAWNIQDALWYEPSSPPVLLIADYFGGGQPQRDFFAVDILDANDFASHDPGVHGYGVLSVIAADYGGIIIGGGLATGLYPHILPVRAVDCIAAGSTSSNPVYLTWQAMEDKIIAAIKYEIQNGKKVVLNTSMGYACTTQPNAFGNSAPADAITWIEKVRNSDLEYRFLHIVSAGNACVQGDTDSRVDGPFQAARLLSPLRRPDGTLVSNLRNILVVQNVIRSSTTPYRPICLNGDGTNASKYPGDLSAIGTDVWVITEARGWAGGNGTGTSFSSAQVAALAAYIGALKPSLLVQEIIDILYGTAQHDIEIDPTLDPRCSDVGPAPAIDAYAALLAVDDRSALTGGDPFDARVRGTLLDVADDNAQFDYQDLELLFAMAASPQVDLDYSRYDLNGDGFTGGDGTERFDLNIDRQFRRVSQVIEDKTYCFDELHLTDLEILCYYAYSPLYTGSADARRNLLSNFVSSELVPMCPGTCDTSSRPELEVGLTGGPSGYSHRVASTGTLSDTRTAMVPGGSLSAEASVGFGSACAKAQYDLVDSRESSSAEAIWSDFIVVTPSNPSLCGQFPQWGTLVGQIRISGTATVLDRGGAIPALAIVQAEGFDLDWRLQVEDYSPGDNTPRANDFALVREVRGFMEFCKPREFSVRTRCSATGTGSYLQTKDAEVEMEIKLQWLGITAILDRNGNPITEYSVCSATGTDYTVVAPEQNCNLFGPDVPEGGPETRRLEAVLACHPVVRSSGAQRVNGTARRSTRDNEVPHVNVGEAFCDLSRGRRFGHVKDH